MILHTASGFLAAMMTLAAMATAPACPPWVGWAAGSADAEDACPAGMGGGGLGMPNLSALTSHAGSFAGVPAPLGGLHNRGAVVAGAARPPRRPSRRR